MILSFFPFDQPLQTNRDIKLMGVGLCSCCNPGVTSDANKGGSSLQHHRALPKAQAGDISRVCYAMERDHRIPGDVTENGGSATS
jgi:hypothetical protein